MAVIERPQVALATPIEFQRCHSPSETELFGGWPAPLARWKSRLPLIVVPLLTGLRNAPRGLQLETQGLGALCPPYLDMVLLYAATIVTGYWHLPFSVTWWLILLSAFALETPLLLGVATVTSLSLLLGWYGVRYRWPHTVEVLWGGTRRKGVAKGSWHRTCWQVWDLFVHMVPAVLIIYWHGPSLNWDASLNMGTVSLESLLVALPLNLVWLWAATTGSQKVSQVSPAKRSHGSKSSYPWDISFAQTNVVYQVDAIPDDAWLWIYASHWTVCLVWFAALILPIEVFFVYTIIGVNGLLWRPYTEAFWILFVSACVVFPQWKLLQGMVACMAVPLAMGFYGPQLFYPALFESLVDGWFIVPVARHLPEREARWFRTFTLTKQFWLAARLVDSCIHAMPAVVTMALFSQSITSAVAWVALPTNMWWLFTTGSKRCADTNRIYGLKPDMPPLAWTVVFGSHWVFCAIIGSALLWSGA